MTSNNAQTSKTKNNDRSASKGGGGTTTTASAQMTVTYDQIAIRAEHIWRQKGCPGGQDEQNWHEAERQLKKELGLR